MAAFLARAFAHVDGSPLLVGQTEFTDIAGNLHEESIRRVATAGFAQGTTATTYSPSLGVSRDQMAACLTRMLERFPDDGRLSRLTRRA